MKEIAPGLFLLNPRDPLDRMKIDRMMSEPLVGAIPTRIMTGAARSATLLPAAPASPAPLPEDPQNQTS
jgi:hypothetical protein